jgi:catechol 2,3-dioxygenase-like lactoylglutathione lyase family enzyme
MSDTHNQTPFGPVLTSIEAQLFVANVQRSCDFYTEKLGFTVEFLYGDPPFYGQLRRDHARLNLRLVFEAVFAGDIRKREGLLSASITVATASEIRQLFLAYQDAGIAFHQILKTEPWGARTFVVSDPDENLILFAGPADSTSEDQRKP